MTRPSLTTAAAVSSQEVSIPRMRIKSRVTGIFKFRPQLGEPVLVVSLLQISAPHHDGVLAAVAVVPLPRANYTQTIYLLPRLGRSVRRAHFQGHPACAAPKGRVDQPHQQP